MTGGNELARLAGCWTDLDEACATLARAQAAGHLISPAASVSALLPGTALSTSLVLVDVKTETYPALNGKGVALKKEALDRIAGAAGVGWEHPVVLLEQKHRIILSVRGSLMQFDGTIRPLEGTKEIDLRDGSSAVEQMIEEAIAKERKWLEDNRQQGDAVARGRARAAKAIAQKRGAMTALSDTGARLRAIRSLGVRQAYDPAELVKPFVAARLVFTGRTGNPDIDRSIAERVAERFLSAGDALFGRRAPVAETPRQVPVEVRDVRTPEEREEDAREAAQAPPLAAPPPREPPRDVPRGTTGPARQVAPEAAAEALRDDEGPPTSRTTRLPKRGGGGPLLCDAEDKDLAYWQGRLADALQSGNSRYADKDQAMLDCIQAEIDYRESFR